MPKPTCKWKEIHWTLSLWTNAFSYSTHNVVKSFQVTCQYAACNEVEHHVLREDKVRSAQVEGGMGSEDSC